MNRVTKFISIISFILFSLLAVPAFAHSGTPNLGVALRKSLPKSLSTLVPGKTTVDQAVKMLGKPAKTKKNGSFYFYEVDGVRYDTTLSFKKGVLEYFYFEPSDDSLRRSFAFDEIKPMISSRDLKAAQKRLNQEPISHETGRFFEVRLHDRGLILKFAAHGKHELVALAFIRKSKESRW